MSIVIALAGLVMPARGTGPWGSQQGSVYLPIRKRRRGLRDTQAGREVRLKHTSSFSSLLTGTGYVHQGNICMLKRAL